MKTHFANPLLRFATALCLLLLAAAHPAFGAVTFSGDTSNSTTVVVGNTGIGSLTIDGGSSLSQVTGVVGNSTGSNGTVTVSGGNWTNSGILRIGASGTGSLTISNGTVTNTSGILGNIAGSNGTVNVSGGNWTNSGLLRVGGAGTGSLTITNGTVSNTDGTVGNIAGSNGTVNVSGGNWTNSSNLTIGSAGNGTLNLTGNGTVSVGSGLVTLATASGITGTLNLGNGTTAGTLSAATITGGDGTAVVNINQNASYTLGSNMTGSLSLNHLGTGTTTLTGNNTYTGGTTVNAGTLEVAAGGSINNTWDLFVGLLSGDNGTLHLNGGSVSNVVDAFVYLGYNDGSVGTAIVSAGNWMNNAGLFVGLEGTGSLTINGTGSVTNSDGYIGDTFGSNGTVSVSGGTWTNNDYLVVGIEGTGSLTINGTGNVTSVNGFVGDQASGNGTVSVSGGAWTNSGDLYVGNFGTGTLNLTGGNVVVGSGSGNITIARETASTGTLNLGTGTTVGTLSAATITGGNGTAVVNINQNGSYTLGSNMTGNLSLNHIGTGTTALTGNNTYTGDTTVKNGILEVATGGSITGGALYIGKTTGDNGTLNLTGGSIDHSGQHDFVGSESSGATGVGTVNVSAGTWINNSFVIGAYGAGTLNLSGTGNITSDSGSLGYEGTGTGTANVSGGSWTIGGLEIGIYGTGTLNLSGGNVTVTGAYGWGSYLGFSTGSLSAANVSGGTWATNQELSIGGDGGTGILNLSGSGLVTNTEGYIGGYPGWSGAGVGIANISGGTWTNTGNLTVGLVGNGTLNLTENGTVSIGGILTLASDAGSTGTLNIGNGTTAGTLSAATITGGNGTAVVNINQSGSYTLGSNMTGSLSLNHIGTGTTALTGMNTYAGTTLVKSGTLEVATGGSINNTWDIFVGLLSGDNGTLTINGTGSVTNSDGYIGHGSGSNGTVSVSGGTWTNRFLLIGNEGTGSLTINGTGNVTNSDGYIGNLPGGNGTVSVSGGTWTNSSNLAVGVSGTGSLTITGGNVTNTSGNIGLNAGSTGVATVSGGNWTNSGNFTVGDSGNGTLNLTGGNVSIAGGAGNLTLAVNASSTGILNIGNGSTAGNLQAARVTAGSGTAIVNFNHTGNYSFAPILAGNLTVNKLGSGTTTLSGNNTYAGGTSIQNGTLSVRAPMALGAGNVSLSTGSLLVASGQEMPGSLQIGGNFDWTGGTIAYYDTGSSPGSNDLQIVVGGNFTASAGNKTFDFSQVDALNSGNYTLVLAGNVTVNLADLIATHGPETTLNGTFSTNGTTIVYTVTGATSGGNVIQNVGGPNTPLVADYAITTSTITVGSTNTIRSLSFSNSAALTINATGQLTITSGNLTVQSGGTSVVSGGTLITSGSLAKQGAGELDLQSNTVVNGVATVVEGLLSVNAQLNANSVVVDPTATLGGAGVIVAQNVVVNGNLSPGNSPGTLSVAGNLVLTGANSTIIEIANPMNFDRIVVTGTATLGGTLNAVGYEGYTIAPGSRFDFLQAGSIVGAYDSITAPEGLRARFLNSGTVGTLLFGPGSYVMMAINQNQRNVAEALDTYILATEGDPLTVSVALDSLTTEQFPAAFDQIMPGFYESLGDILIEQTYNQAQLLTQRLGSVRLGATGFQAIGMSQPIKYDKDGKSAADAKTASPIVEAPVDTNWNSWVIANGEFSLSRGLSGVPNYNNNAGGFLVGADYRLSENFAAGLFAGYEYSYAKYDGGSSTRGNSALFGLYGSYTHEDGYYADAIVSGGYTGFQTRRSIEFSTIDRTASADPNSGQFSAALNLGKDFEIGKFTLGPIVGAQYTYAGIGGFTESGADSLDLALGQQNANSLRTNLGARLAYNWEVGSNITLIPEVRGFWMHEFLNNPRNISSALDGGSGASFDYETSAPYRNSVFGGVGISAKFADRWSASVFYNVNFGAEGYTNNIISTSLGFSF